MPTYHSDLVLIAGRFRVACGLNSFDKITNTTIVLYDDFVHRKEYYVVLKCYDLIEVRHLMVALRKENVPPPTPDLITYYEMQSHDRPRPGIRIPLKLPPINTIPQ
jgi:hypothetical protein